MKYTHYDSPVGRLLLAGNETLETIRFPDSKQGIQPEPAWKEALEFFKPVISQLDDYFNGRLKAFNIEMTLIGTEFQKQVWSELAKVPYGTTISYGELAQKIGNPKASRAVGMANGKNPIPIIIPCHRVIGKDGTLTGFGGGLDVKQTLLELEKKR